MDENVMIDSSFFICRFRERQDPLAEIALADPHYDFFSCGVVMAEVCGGMATAKLRKAVRAKFAVMCWVPTTDKIWDRVADIAFQLARKDIQMKTLDLVIAASALEAQSSVLTFDSDYKFVPGLRVISSLN